jgi:hypothetical protein
MTDGARHWPHPWDPGPRRPAFFQSRRYARVAPAVTELTNPCMFCPNCFIR